MAPRGGKKLKYVKKVEKNFYKISGTAQIFVTIFPKYYPLVPTTWPSFNVPRPRVKLVRIFEFSGKYLIRE